MVLGQTVSFLILLKLNHGKEIIDSKTGNLIGVDPNTFFNVLNLGFFMWIMGIWAVLHFIHKRPFLSVITTSKRLNLAPIFCGAVVLICIYIFETAVTWMMFPRHTNYLYECRILYLLYHLLYSSLLCEGSPKVISPRYLLRTWLSYKKSMNLSLISSLLFAMGHLGGSETFTTQIYIGLSTFFFGFILCLVTIRTNSLEMAIGAHTANNLFAALLVNPPDPLLKTSSVFRHTVLMPQFEFAMDVLSGMIFYYLAVMVAVLDRIVEYNSRCNH